MKPALSVGDDVIVSENGVHHAKVTKVARVYLTVSARGREWQFDKVTWRHRGDHGGYVPQLRTPLEHETRCAWEVLRKAIRDAPYASSGSVTLESIHRATAAILALSPRPEAQDGDDVKTASDPA